MSEEKKERFDDPLDGLISDGLNGPYRKMREAGRVPKDEAADFLGDARTLEELTGRGLVHLMPHSPAGVPVYQAAPLDVAYAAILTTLLGEVSDKHEQIMDCIKRLAEALIAPPADEDTDWGQLVRVLTEPEEIAQLSQDMINSAKRDWMSLELATSEKPLTEDCTVVQATSLRGSVRVRAIYDQAAAEHPVISKNMVRARKAGEQQRVVPVLPVKFQLVDESMALVALTETGTQGALLIRGVPPVLRALRQYFELLWERAIPAGGEHVPDGCPLTAEEYVVLQMIAKGLTDESIKGNLGVSRSTVQRKINAIYKHLHVTSRFAAGMAVQRFGWLNETEIPRTEDGRDA